MDPTTMRGRATIRLACPALSTDSITSKLLAALDYIDKLEAERDALRAELERAREALRVALSYRKGA